MRDGDLSRSFIVAIYGTTPSVHPAAGEMMALVQVEAGADQVLVDRERNRVRIERTPGSRDLEKWCSPTGLILAARRGVWGLSIVEDHYSVGAGPLPITRTSRWPSRPSGRASREVIPSRLEYPRATIPEDVCSCLRCRDLVIARRSRWCGVVVKLAAPGRLFRRILATASALSGCQGPGAAHVIHGVDCAAYRLEDSGPLLRGRRSRGLLLGQLIRALLEDPVGERFLTGRRTEVRRD